MSSSARPLRFLGAVLGSWIALRAFALAPGWADEAMPDLATTEPSAPAATGWAPLSSSAEMPASVPFAPAQTASWSWAAPPAVQSGVFAPIFAVAADPSLAFAQTAGSGVPPPPPGVAQLFPSLPSPPAGPGRWSGSAWLFVRDSGDPALAPGGELGGSQAGARLTYRLFGRRAPLALSGRLYVPLNQPEGAEAAIGLDWRPLPRVPINILAERREAIGRDGRSDFALTLYGGGERRLGPVRLEAWGQAGAVGLDGPDLFADGLVRATARLGPLDIGGGLWGGAQPGVSRLDAGPHVSARIPIRGVPVRVMGEWRFRVAGDAAPGSGPALTVASGF